MFLSPVNDDADAECDARDERDRFDDDDRLGAGFDDDDRLGAGFDDTDGLGDKIGVDVVAPCAFGDCVGTCARYDDPSDEDVCVLVNGGLCCII